ncbi:MAG: GIY-YIG nuclease family protein [Selenomonadaceae bacterium]|nr:GIY-YIG nuclease family protein [Selenomonadaceae bacterium]
MNDDIMNKSMVIYRITNNLNGKIYIGQTQKTLRERMAGHLCDALYVDNAIKKYGIENFTIEVVEDCETPEELNDRERYWIAFFNCIAPNGYNLTDGGSNASPSDETREKISNTLKEYYEQNPEKRQEISEFQKKRFEDPEERQKAAERTRKSFENPEVAAKHAESQRRRFEREEERQKIVEFMTGREMPQETRDKISATLIEFIVRLVKSRRRWRLSTIRFWSKNRSISPPLNPSKSVPSR